MADAGKTDVVDNRVEAHRRCLHTAHFEHGVGLDLEVLFAEITALWGYGTSGRESSGSRWETLKRSTSWIPSARKPSE
jgi:hypothetical protein